MNLLISSLRRQYLAGSLTPATAMQEVLARCDAAGEDNAWISRVSAAGIAAQVAMLEQRRATAGGSLAGLPLYGVPFAIKDNIDYAGMHTTAACKEFAFMPVESAAVVQRLVDAGAILVGKTNLDQFATGLVGTRSPYGAVKNSFKPEYISGGSSSGSASVVARGLVSFALGTDTAGSGRIPAGFNNIVGIKPTVGRLSARGMLPACRSLDCVSIFALTAADGAQVLAAASGFDPGDTYSRHPAAGAATLGAAPRLGIPAQLEFFGDAEQQRVFEQAVERAQRMGAVISSIDLSPFLATAALLYDGPWVAERYAAIETVMRERPEIVHPVVREVIAGATAYSAVDAFKAYYRREELRRMTAPVWKDIDALLVPSAPTIYTIKEVNDDPVVKNSHLGTYTNFVNLLDLCAIAVPAAMRNDGLPFGITLIAPAWYDEALVGFADRWQHDTGLPLGATGLELPAQDTSALAPPAPGHARIAVVGAHLRGLPLNHQLTTRGARFAGEALSAPAYRLYALPGTVPPKPGMLRADGGASIALELWDVPLESFGAFVAEVPPPLAIGSVQLQDGAWVKGFVCEGIAAAGATDISSFGGWRAYLASLAKA
ncbi:MAG: allophanate hydrolase [Betaproteobacteria bacterium]|nr:allophanate hydrolase [Betaproteobacteria bacterium]